jgi:cell division protein FtsZ
MEFIAPPVTSKPPVSIKVFGLGKGGIAVTDLLIAGGMPPTAVVALDLDDAVLAGSQAAVKVQVATPLLRGLGSGGDPDRAKAAAEEQVDKLKALCQEVEVVFLVAGLGGGTATGIGPILARTARESGALVLGFVTIPFDCEGSRRRRLAQAGIEELREAADGVICLPNQKAVGLIDENTSLLETFRLTNEMLADGVRGVWRLLMHKGLIEIHLSDLCALLRDQHMESAFAVAESAGATRSRDVLEKLLAHPLLDNGRVLEESHTVLASLMGGPDLTMAEVNRVMEAINQRCPGSQLIMGAALDESFRERLAVTLIASIPSAQERGRPAHSSGETERLDRQLLGPTTTRPQSRFVLPAPTLSPEKMAQLLAHQSGSAARARRGMPKLRQGQLPLEIVTKGRFDKSEPTIHKGEDLDVPTYIRRGVALN